jgi:hypothetical protein
MKSVVYHVSQQEGRWCAHREDKPGKSVCGGTKRECVTRVKAMARCEHGHVVIHDIHGSIEEEFTYLSAGEAHLIGVSPAQPIVFKCSVIYHHHRRTVVHETVDHEYAGRGREGI